MGEGDVVWLESPRNPDLRVPDVAGACAGPADVVVDATFAPLAQRLLDDDVACVVHSATDGVETPRQPLRAIEQQHRVDAWGA